MEFLDLFGKSFDYSQTMVDANQYKYSNILHVRPFVNPGYYFDSIPCIIDPITGLNVAKSSFRIEEVRESFSQMYDFFSGLKLLHDKKDIHSDNLVIDCILNAGKSK